MNNKEKVSHNRATYEGKIFPTNYDGEVKVLEYINSKNILIEFMDTQYQNNAQLGNLLSRLIKDDSISFMHNIEGLVYGDEVGRSKLPIGVSRSYTKDSYVACLNRYGNNVHLGTFNTVEEAFQAYKQAKEHHVKEVANKWKGQIDMRVYETLVDWSININD